MTNDTDIMALRQPESVDDPLTEIARDGARRMLAALQKTDPRCGAPLELTAEESEGLAALMAATGGA